MNDAPLRIERSAKTLRELAFERMRDAIMSFHFQPGERLVERSLCDQLGVSRSVVREVLRQLEAEGLVETIPGHGPAVATPDLKHAEEIYELRALLEGIAAGMAAQNATREQIAQLEAALGNIRDAWAEGGPIEIMRATTEFYAVLFEAAGKVITWEIVQGLNVRINQLRSMTITSPERRKAATSEMESITRAIKKRQPEEATTAAQRHIESAWAIARDVLSKA